MSSKRPRLQKIVSPKGIASYPHLAEPDTFKGKTEYKTSLILDPSDEGVAEYMATIEKAAQKAYDEGIAELKQKLDDGEFKGKRIKEVKEALENIQVHLPFEPEYSEEGEETGRYVFKFKALAGGVYQSGKNKGKEWTRDLPIFDTQKNEVSKDGLRLWGGSTIRVQAEMNPYCMEATSKAGVSLRLYSVQIIELSGGNADAADGFGVEDGYTAEQSAPSAADGFDDEGPAGGEEDDDF